MFRAARLPALALAGLLLSSAAAFAAPKVVSGPGPDANCFKPWTAQTKYMQWDKKPGPYRIAVVNGFVGNTWRIQMIQTAKAFAEQAGVKEKIKEFKVVSTGTDVAAQLGAIEDFINQGYDAIITIAVAPDGFDRVIRLADRNNVVIVPFDNVLDTDKVMQVNEDQLEIGRLSARHLLKELGTKRDGKILEVRGLPGNSVDRDRHLGFREVMEKEGKFQIVEVVGNWDDGTAQKATADALAVHGKFEAVFTQGGSTGLRARHDGRQASLRADGGRGRERLPQARREALRRGPEGPLLQPVPGPRVDLHQGRDLGARREPDAAAHLGADPGGRLHDPEGQRELLVEPLRQLLRRQRIPRLRRQRHGAGDHGEGRQEHAVNEAPRLAVRPHAFLSPPTGRGLG
jgi:ribose transport system substrate-binding protein